jgi:two-component system OmpR family sensor kinase
MSGIGSTLRKHWVEIAWAVFSGACVAVVLTLSRWETVPFHLIWVSLTLLYGFRVWRSSTTAIVLGVVMATTGAALAIVVIEGQKGLDEVAEVPLMASMFVVMAWHAQRRQRAVEEVSRSAETERRVLDRQREFVRDASHELRTPVTVARGHAELIRETTAEDQTVRDVDVILDEMGRLSKLSDRLLVLAGADHPGFLAFDEVPVEPLITETIRRWGPTAQREWGSSSPASGVVVADRERLGAALDALIENAVNATVEGGRISLSTEASAGTLVLAVSDDGDGIAAEDLPQVFERFSRRERDRARGSGGTGLGLAIVQAIVEAHDGSVEVESALETGTTFRIRLPRYRDGVVVELPGSDRPASHEPDVLDPLPTV